MKWSKFKWSLRRPRRRPSDPLRTMGGQVFAEHSRELLAQAQAFVHEVAERHDLNGVAPAETGRAYMDFVRRRKASLEKGLLAELALLEWYRALEREAARREISERLGLDREMGDATAVSTAIPAPDGERDEPPEAHAKDVNDEPSQHA